MAEFSINRRASLSHICPASAVFAEESFPSALNHMRSRYRICFLAVFAEESFPL